MTAPSPVTAPAGALPSALTDWLAHCVLSVPMRDIAAARAAAPSTILRRVRRVEALSDCTAWALVLEGLTAARSRLTAAIPDLGAGDLVEIVTGLSVPRARAAFLEARPVLAEPGVRLVLTRSLPKAALVGEGRAGLPVDRDMALAWLVLGWVGSAANSGKIARLVLTQAGRAVQAAADPAPPRPRRGRPPQSYADPVARLQQGRPAPLADGAEPLLRSLTADTATPRARARLEAAGIPPRWAGFMLEVLSPEGRMEAIEARHGLPKRTGRVVLLVLLDVLAAHETGRAAA